MKEQNNKKVLMLCTGGTIGMLPKDDKDPKSPLVPASWEKIRTSFPVMSDLPFYVSAKEMDDLIDSSDMNPKYWIKIARKIRDEYKDYDGFVILHGTDTMAYTATALSFLLENLGKPVIVTGSQLPLAQPRNDAAQNLVISLMLAASYNVPTIPEVCILFNNVLLRGNRSRKVSSSGLAGFDSPNFPPLAVIGEHIEVNTSLIRKIPSEGFFINEFLTEDVMVLDIFPGINTKILNSVFSIQGLEGVILRTYGTGNAPTDNDFLREIEYAIVKKRLAIVNITQCNQGRVEMGLYDASSGLLRLGVISGVDMTPEAALVKMMFLRGQGYDIETVKEQMQKNICGEQSINVFNLIYNDRAWTEEGIYRLKAQQLPAGYVKNNIETASIRFDNISIKNGEKQIKFAVFMNYPSADKETAIGIPQCLGVIEKNYEGESTDCTLRCTEEVKQVISDPGRPVQITIVSYNNDIIWESAVLSIYTEVD